MKKILFGIAIFAALLILGHLIHDKQETDTVNPSESASLEESVTESRPEATADVVTPQPGAEESPEQSGAGTQESTQETTSIILPEGKNWGLGFGEAGQRPRGNESIEALSEYNAYFCADKTDNVLYLTFDCGYEIGCTEAILDALKKHDVKATFFVVGHYLNTAAELVQRMVDEGHIVGNHSYHHPDMTQMNDVDAFKKELEDVEAKFEELTGQKMAKYFRPPQGKYNDRCLQMAEDLGYATFFWSVAYVDWNQNDQPSHNSAFETLTKRTHPGAIVLLHNTSQTNAEILDEMLTKWEGMGYTFGTLEEFAATDGTKVENSGT